MQIEVSQAEPKNQPGRKFRKYYVVIVLVVLAFFLGLQFGRSGQRLIPKNFNFIELSRDKATKDVDWQLLWDTLDQINQKFVDRPADKQKILYGAVQGAVAALGDPYSIFFPPKEAEDFHNELKGKFDGIGAEIGMKNQQLVVITPLDGSPAIKAGIKAGDLIYKIDGKETLGLSVEDAVNKIRGAAGTKVMLTVFHKGQTKPVDISITRAKIEVKSVSKEIKAVGGKKLGYIKMRRFGEDTEGLFDRAVTDFLVSNIQGLILDLRNNPGGYLDTAVTLAGNWVPAGQTVVIQRFGQGNEETYAAKGPTRLSGIPTIVLINGGSASASEILAGALHDHGLAKLVGEKSFGKGSVQELITLRDKADLKLTIAKWLTPSGHDLNKEGIEPDIKVELKEEDFQNDRDPQLDKAIEMLK